MNVPGVEAATALGALANTLGIDLLISKAITQQQVDTILELFFHALADRRSGMSRNSMTTFPKAPLRGSGPQ